MSNENYVKIVVTYCSRFST